LLLSQDDDFYLSYVNGLSPGRKRRRERNVNDPDMPLLDQEINGLSIRCAQAQAVDDDLMVNPTRDENLITELEQQA